MTVHVSSLCLSAPCAVMDVRAITKFLNAEIDRSLVRVKVEPPGQSRAHTPARLHRAERQLCLHQHAHTLYWTCDARAPMIC
jgi:hypothetical protein